jgi:hypothetical protein
VISSSADAENGKHSSVSDARPSKDDGQLSELALAMKEIESGTDRICAIVTAALIEEELENAIRKRFEGFEKLYRDDESEKSRDYISEISRSLKVNSFLGSMDPKVRLAYLLGIIGQEGRDNLLAIANIRNHFAHRHGYRSFEDDRLKQIFKSITAYQRTPVELRILMRLGATVIPISTNANRRQRFMQTVRVLLISIRFRSFEDTFAMHDPPSL